MSKYTKPLCRLPGDTIGCRERTKVAEETVTAQLSRIPTQAGRRSAGRWAQGLHRSVTFCCRSWEVGELLYSLPAFARLRHLPPALYYHCAWLLLSGLEYLQVFSIN